MNIRLHIACVLGIAVLLISTALPAQDDETALPSETGTGEATAEEPEVRAGQEVEINEDNYRQFMELKDPNLQRNIIPENVFKPGSGLQKLDKLPEESQKHLRNQLREIIVQGDEWQPGDEETEYPYTPSAAASTDPALEKQELEAWGELVDSYHERESQIYENSSGMQTARGSEQGSSNSQQNGAGSSDRPGQQSEGSQGQQAGQEGTADQPGSEGTYSLNGSADSSTNGTAGVSQNAMEFLQGLGQGGSNASNSATQSPPQDQSSESMSGSTQNAMEFLKGNTGQSGGLAESGSGQSGDSGEDNTTSSTGDQGQGESDGGEQGEEQAMAQESGAQGAGQEGEQADSQEGEQAQDGQLAESSESPASTNLQDSSAQSLPNQPEEESTAGASQNALEYLTGEDPRAIDGAISEAGEDQPEGTLSIQDLLNAQGIGDSTNVAPATAGSGEEGQADEDKPEKDGGGR